MKNKFTPVLRTAAFLLMAGMLALSVNPVHAETKQTSEKEETDRSESPGVKMNMEDGEYSIQVDLEGGSGKAGVVSPTVLIVRDGRAFTRLQWSSSNYDYMIVDGEKYLPINTEGNSVFEIPIKEFDCPLHVVGDTVAMSEPHEIEYTLTFHSETKKELK